MELRVREAMASTAGAKIIYLDEDKNVIAVVDFESSSECRYS